MHICTVIKEKVQSLKTEQNKYVFERDLNDDSDGVHQTSFWKEFQTEEEAKENEQSPSVGLLCAGLLRRGMVHELEWVLRVCHGFFCMSATYDGAYCCGITNKLFFMCFLLWQEANEVILNMRLY